MLFDLLGDLSHLKDQRQESLLKFPRESGWNLFVKRISTASRQAETKGLQMCAYRVDQAGANAGERISNSHEEKISLTPGAAVANGSQEVLCVQFKTHKSGGVEPVVLATVCLKQSTRADGMGHNRLVAQLLQ